ncbi:gliding motility-associated C-terminal domain-containing protein [Lutibacter agarilyticus]|uniref:Gliding motility-associated C-terminal domain-containing protein n=1 Tax=Lutibacter agarilyticus TaxID=1109740 RepID=A0A238XHQ7_9FLAO|nr:T9SS type B sorting domain-containing protein [Lutibacter agarilyticus]SNR58546.1 gliding motility-associated C-terminal domain-containing protein [Lutibacter agarilyticus]
MKKILLLIFLFSSLTFFAQGEANHWFFGQNSGIDFNGGTATPISGSLDTYEGCASFSNSSGELLFYTDGITVWDKNHQKMTNGQNLLGNPSSTQSAIIVPHPGNNSQYYIFTVGANDYDFEGNLIKATEGLHSYKVDMTARGGLGDVVEGPIILSGNNSANWTEKITSVKGSDCNSFWVISLVDNTYVSFKIDAFGLQTTPVYSTVTYNSEDPRGYLKVAPNGKKIASATYGAGQLYLYSFNDTTGKVSNDGVSLITNPRIHGYSYGVEFSPNSSKLYVTTFDGDSVNNLYQFDVNDANIPDTRYLISSQVGYRGALQLAPNGKIYSTVPSSYEIGTRYLNAINVPNETKEECNFELKALDLGSGLSMQGLPPFIASLLIPVEITDGVSVQNLNNTVAKRCIGENYQFTAQAIEGNPTYKWTLNNLVISTSATLNLPNLSTVNEGIYYFEAETIDDCGFKISYNGNVELEVYQPPTITKPTNILQCDDDNDGIYTFDFSTTTSEILNGQDATLFEVVYFTNQLDADNNSNAIVEPYTNSVAITTETLYARIHNIHNPICYETESFELHLFESPAPPNTITNLTTCDSNTTGTDTDGFEIFDLTAKETEILNGQLASDFTIEYFEEATLTLPISNKTAYKNTIQNIQPIYFQITSNLNSNCIISSSFNIEVLVLPVINDVFTFKQCDEDGTPDGFTNFNLNEANEYLTLNNPNLVVSYFLSFNNATANTNSITPTPFSNSTAATVYARIENQNGCFRIAQVDLLVSSTSFPSGYLKTSTTCDDDDTIDGLHFFNLSENDTEIISLFPTGQNLNVKYYKNLEDAQLEQNTIEKTTPYFSETPFSQILYVRVESEDNGACFGLGPYLELVVQPRPEFDLDVSAIYCLNLNPITVAVNNAKGNYTYIWMNNNGTEISNNAFATINKEGIYTVIATSSAGCKSFPASIKIEPSSVATISQNDITVVDDSENNSITIATTNLGIGDYEFALDSYTNLFQDEPYFENVSPGIHTVFVRDKNYCGITSIDVSVIGYPKFFTPNNDGFNDTWKVLGINETFYNASNIYIYDRYGKLITQIDPRGNGWNGLYNGQTLPSSDYWFSVELIGNDGTSKIRKGHFSLVRK